MRIRVASSGVRKMSAKNLCVHVYRREISTHDNEVNGWDDGLSNSRGTKIYRRAILDRHVLVTSKSYKLLFPKLIASEFSSALHEIAYCGRPESGQERRGALFRNDETTPRKQAVARKRWVYLNARLYDIYG